MKKCIYLILVLAATLTSCEDVIELDLPTATPRLVIEASIDWQKGTTGNEQRIKITKTTDFYSTTVEALTGADVSVMGNGQTFNFIQDATGDYVCGNFDPALNETYVLTVLYNNEVYTASETLIPTPTLENVIQDNDGGFTGEDIELKFTFQDDGTTDNFYMFKFTSPINPLPNYDVVDDDFFQGNTRQSHVFSDIFLLITSSPLSSFGSSTSSNFNKLTSSSSVKFAAFKSSLDKLEFFLSKFQ